MGEGSHKYNSQQTDCFCVLVCLQRSQLEDVKHEEQEALETQSIPLRNYLLRNVMPTLTQGLIEVCKIRPDDPIDYLVTDTAPYNKLPSKCTENCIFYRQNIYSRTTLKSTKIIEMKIVTVNSVTLRLFNIIRKQLINERRTRRTTSRAFKLHSRVDHVILCM